MNPSAVLDRMLEPVGRALNREAARELVNLRADPEVQARVAELAGKCNEGDLTQAERAEYERYVAAGSVIAVLRAKARLALARTAPQ